jgi:uncharacterized protein YbbK (DUF523 family)
MPAKVKQRAFFYFIWAKSGRKSLFPSFHSVSSSHWIGEWSIERGIEHNPGEKERMLRLFPIPVVVTSRCLGFQACRYDGTMLAFPWAERWRGYVRFESICPEMGLGLGAPRPTMRLVQQLDGSKLVVRDTGEDLTGRMTAFVRAWLDDLPQADGFILKEQSPSCGLRQAKRYQGVQDTEPVGRGPGLFAAAATERHFLKPAADEAALDEPAFRDVFLVRLFASAAIHQARRAQTLEALQKAYARYRPLVAEVWPERAEEMDRVLAPKAWTGFEALAEAFEEGLLGALKRYPVQPVSPDLHLYPDALR